MLKFARGETEGLQENQPKIQIHVLALFNDLYERRAVSLPGDREEDRERERSIGDQLNNIFSHIEVEEHENGVKRTFCEL